MGAPEVMMRLAAAGIRLKPLPDGRVWAEPRAALTDDLRDLIRAHKAELLTALSAHTLGDSAAEARRRRLLAMLDAQPGARYAVLTDTQADPEAVIVALAIRGRATCELRVPREKWDGVLFLELLDRHSGTVH